MSFDVVLSQARLAADPDRLVDIGIHNGRIAAVAPSLANARHVEVIGGNLVVPGFVETHIDLDKSCIMDRCNIREGGLKEASAETRARQARIYRGRRQPTPTPSKATTCKDDRNRGSGCVGDASHDMFYQCLCRVVVLQAYVLVKCLRQWHAIDLTILYFDPDYSHPASETSSVHQQRFSRAVRTGEITVANQLDSKGGPFNCFLNLRRPILTRLHRLLLPIIKDGLKLFPKNEGDINRNTAIFSGIT